MASINEVRPSRRSLYLTVGCLIAVVFAAGSLLVESGQSLAGEERPSPCPSKGV